MDKTKFSKLRRRLSAIAMATAIGIGGVGGAAIAMSSSSPATDSAIIMDVNAASTSCKIAKPTKITVTNCGNATVNLRLWTTSPSTKYRLHITTHKKKVGNYTFVGNSTYSDVKTPVKETSKSTTGYANITSIKHFNAYNVSKRPAYSWTETIDCYITNENKQKISNNFKIVIAYRFSGGSNGKTTVTSIKLA